MLLLHESFALRPGHYLRVVERKGARERERERERENKYQLTKLLVIASHDQLP